MKIQIKYLYHLLTVKDKSHNRKVLKKMAIILNYMRAKQTGREGTFDKSRLHNLGLNEQSVEELFRILAIAKYEDRFIIPQSHKEETSDANLGPGTCGIDFEGGPGSCGVMY